MIAALAAGCSEEATGPTPAEELADYLKPMRDISPCAILAAPAVAQLGTPNRRPELSESGKCTVSVRGQNESLHLTVDVIREINRDSKAVDIGGPSAVVGGSYCYVIVPKVEHTSHNSTRKYGIGVTVNHGDDRTCELTKSLARGLKDVLVNPPRYGPHDPDPFGGRDPCPPEWLATQYSTTSMVTRSQLGWCSVSGEWTGVGVHFIVDRRPVTEGVDAQIGRFRGKLVPGEDSCTARWEVGRVGEQIAIVEASVSRPEVPPCEAAHNFANTIAAIDWR